MLSMNVFTCFNLESKFPYNCKKKSNCCEKKFKRHLITLYFRKQIINELTQCLQRKVFHSRCFVEQMSSLKPCSCK